MPKITVVDFMGEVVKEFDVEKGTKLLKALIEQGVDIVHSCGGKAKCTTCRITARKGIPRKVTQAQKKLFDHMIKGGQPQFDAPQVFLSCQIIVENDMKFSVSEEYNKIIHESRGKDVADEITPEPEWLEHEVPDWLGDG